MHSDYLNVTVPDTDSRSVTESLLEIVSSVGAVAAHKGLYKLSGRGTLKLGGKPGYELYSASGGLLEALREHGMYSTYLTVFGEVPHRVTQLHVAHDVYDLDAPKLLQALYRRADGQPGIHLTRKRAQPKQIMAPGRDGRTTGTVYLGTRKSEAWAKVYDKAQERWDRAREEWPPCVRFELSVSGKAGVSLRDAYSPESIFWHYMRDVLGPPPSDVPDWEPGAQGFSLPSKVSLLPAEALRRLVESSPQLEQMLDLSRQLGPHGYAHLMRLINARCLQHARASTDQPGFAMDGASSE